MEVRVESPARPGLAVWEGGSILASRGPSFEGAWMTKHDYDEYGNLCTSGSLLLVPLLPFVAHVVCACVVWQQARPWWIASVFDNVLYTPSKRWNQKRAGMAASRNEVGVAAAEVCTDAL